MFTENEVTEKLKSAFISILGVDAACVPTASIGKTESWDSLTHMELMLRISQDFGLGRLSASEIVSLDSFDSAKKFVFEKLRNESSY